MEDWVKRALQRWPNVPALFGWLRLDRRGRWLIKDELISRPQIIDTIASNYAADEQGRWYFQNGPQRGYVALDHMPLLLRTADDGSLHTHTGLRVEHIDAVFLDEEGSLLLSTEHGPAALDAADLSWALERLRTEAGPASEEALLAALSQASGTVTALRIEVAPGRSLPVSRLDDADAPAQLGFVREPQANSDL